LSKHVRITKNRVFI